MSQIYQAAKTALLETQKTLLANLPINNTRNKVAAAALVGVCSLSAYWLKANKPDPLENTSLATEPTSIETHYIRLTPAEQKKKIQRESNEEYENFLKKSLGENYIPPKSQITPTLETHPSVLQPQKPSQKWNMEGLFKYPAALSDGLNKLLRLPVDIAFNKAVIIESGGHQFDNKGNVIRSTANAIGIAQVLPSTAKVIAQRCTGSLLDEHRFYYDATYNESLGRCYFKEQYQTYGNNVMAALAYNTGPGNLDKHISRVGDPSKGEINIIDFIKTIPYAETRLYTLHMMKKGGLLDETNIGADVLTSPDSFIQSTRKLPYEYTYQKRFSNHVPTKYTLRPPSPSPIQGTQNLYGYSSQTVYLGAK